MGEASPSAGVQAKVSLREVSAQTVRYMCDLSVAPGQERFVAPNAVSIAEAYFCENAWFRAIKLPGALNLAIHDPPATLIMARVSLWLFSQTFSSLKSLTTTLIGLSAPLD
jgi:hypothetical protein